METQVLNGVGLNPTKKFEITAEDDPLKTLPRVPPHFHLDNRAKCVEWVETRNSTSQNAILGKIQLTSEWTIL